MKKLTSEKSLLKQNSKNAIAMIMLAVLVLYSPSTIFAQNGLITGATVTVYELASFSFTTIDLVNKDGKIGCTTTTDKEGNFFFQTIPDGIWKVKISKRTGKLPKVGTMELGGVKDIVCCCPGP